MTTLPIIPMYAAGDVRQIGMGSAAPGWEDFFHSTTRTKPIAPTPREWANVFGCLHLHNPFGLFESAPADEDTEGADKEFPMRFEQIALAQELAVRNLVTPHNAEQNPPEVVAKRVNVLEFVQAGLRFPHELACYVGAPHRFKRIGRESQASWVDRAIAAVEPILSVASTLGIDNTLGSKPAYNDFYKGEFGVVADFIKRLFGRGKKVDNEPAGYITDDWLNNCGKVIAEKFIRDRTRLNAGKSVWEDRVGKKVNGKVIDHEPLAIPGTYGEPVKIIAGTKYEWSDTETMAHLEKLHDDFPHAKILVHAGHLPRELAN